MDFTGSGVGEELESGWQWLVEWGRSRGEELRRRFPRMELGRRAGTWGYAVRWVGVRARIGIGGRGGAGELSSWSQSRATSG